MIHHQFGTKRISEIPVPCDQPNPVRPNDSVSVCQKDTSIPYDKPSSEVQKWFIAGFGNNFNFRKLS